MTDIRAFHRRSLLAATEIVNQVDATQLDTPTPCAKWTLGELLAHMVVQNYGFAAAARGLKTELAVWEPKPIGDDPGAAFAASAAVMAESFAEDGVPERGFWLPELSTTKPFPGKMAIGFHFVDNIAHGWDVAKAIGIPAHFDEDLLEAVLPIAESVPDGPPREREGSMFSLGVPVPDSAPLLDRIVAMLGRDPAWRPTA